MTQLRFSIFFLFFFIHALSSEEVVPNHTVNIPMQDGTQLPTDIYLPKKTIDKPPCVLIRSPAGRQAATAKEYIYLKDAGYTVAIQETRSSLDKEGKTLPYMSDGWCHHQDGFDTVEWLSKSEFTNGCIGTVGSSALGITQILMAPSAPPSLKCQYISMAAASMYHDALFPGGKLLKNQVEGWLGLFARDPSVQEFVCSQPEHSPFWKNFDSRQMANKVKVPGFHYGGWYDIFIQGTIDAFTSRQEKGGRGAFGAQKLVIGPWTHSWPRKKNLGDFEVPTLGEKPPIDVTAQLWLDYHLKGTVNAVASLPPITYYVMGPFDGSSSKGNVWKFADRWPIPSQEVALYLSPEKKLTEKGGLIDKGFLSFTHHANNPIPTIGGRNLFLESGPKDQRAIESRNDLLVFTSDPLVEDLEVTGRILAHLFVSSDKNDMDFSVRLCDVYPDGKSILICDGLTRSTFAEAQKDIKKITIDLWSTSIVFAKGHKIRIIVSSSNYPRYEKNSFATATNFLYVGGEHPSSIVLPVVSN